MNEKTQQLMEAIQYFNALQQDDVPRAAAGFDLSAVLEIVLQLLPLLSSGVTPAALVTVAMALMRVFVKDSEFLSVIERIVTLLLEILA
jgi:hypothetical protein